jgi:hypothetical protein
MYRHYQSPAVYSVAEARALIQRALASAAELRRDTDTLPRVNPDGSSECPFAEDLFYRKERTAQFVRDDLRQLRDFLTSCTNHIAIGQNKIHELAHEREALNGRAAQDWFAEAELRWQAQLRNDQQVRRDLIDTIAEIEATLREAGARQFPGGDPRGPFGKRLYSEPHLPQPIEDLTRDRAKQAIENLRRETRHL